MLLELPPELIQLVLQNSTTQTFMQLTFSCRTLFEIASNCREVILHHLRRIPGLNLDVESSSTKDLFRLLMKRSFRQLYGAQFHASRRIFNSERQAVDPRASSFATFGDPNLALVFKGDKAVHLFHAHNGDILPRCHLRPPWEQSGQVEVLKTAFDGDNGIYVLQRFTPSVEQDGSDGEHPFVKHALRTNSNQITYLAYHALGSPNDNVRICVFPDHIDYQPLGFAAASRDAFAISWQHVRESSQNEVVLYTDLQESADDTSGITNLSYNSHVIMEGSGERPGGHRSHQVRSNGSLPSDEKGPVIDLAFNDRFSQLLYYYRAQSIYGSFQRINIFSSSVFRPKLHENSCAVQFSESLSLMFSIAIPFFGKHETRHAVNPQTCRWQYLSFGIATHREENWTVACLLKSEALCRARNCGHVLNLERGRRFLDWTVVGRLWGFQDSTNSLGCIVAASNHGTRLAVANWNTIYIWALEPNALIERNASGFYPPCSQSASSGMIELRPVTLQLGAVCFKLRFTDKEDELLALTDRGVVYWNFGPLGKGERTVHKLEI